MKKTIVIIVAVVLVLAGSLFIWQITQKSPKAQEEAIRKAMDYKSDDMCLAVMTPAVHKASGARHTFGSSCLPPGWVSER